MNTGVYDFTLKKGEDFSVFITLQRADGSWIDLTDTGVCVQSSIVEFDGLEPITSFEIEEVLPSGVYLKLSALSGLLLPYDTCYYDVFLNDASNIREHLLDGTITINNNRTPISSCQ